MEQYLVPLDTLCVYFDDTFLSATEADEAYDDLWKNTAWETSSKINRWVCLCQDIETEAAPYHYRDAPRAAVLDRTTREGEPRIIPFSPTIKRIQTKLCEWYAAHNPHTQQEPQPPFNVCLLNFYETGHQRIGWHVDREELGRTTPIASISLGATRQFSVRSITQGATDRVTLPLTKGSLLVMDNACQHHYVHSVPKEPNVREGRINLTFRCKTEGTVGEDMHERRDHWLNELAAEVGTAATRAWSSHESSASGMAPTASGGGAVFGDAVSTGDDVEATAMRFVVKTNLGAECYCAAEIQEVLERLMTVPVTVDKDSVPPNVNTWTVMARPCGMDGYVAICSDNDASTNDMFQPLSVELLRLRSAHFVLHYHAHFDLKDCYQRMFNATQPGTTALDDPVNDTDDDDWCDAVTGEMLYEYCKLRLVEGSLSVSTLMAAQSFRVTCERIGLQHGFRAPEVEREVGGALAEFYDHCTPSMSDYDVNVRVDVVGFIVVVGTQLNVHDLSKERHFLEYRNAVTIKTNLAYAMVRCANIQPGHRIADPFCGSGTLLLEALDVYPQIHCVGLDVLKRSVEGSRKNALAEHYGPDVCTFVCSDARGLRRHLDDNSIDAMITNLPWGVMTGHKDANELQVLYEIFLRNSWYVLKDGARIVMLVLRGLQLMRIIRKLSGRYQLLSVNVVRTTNNLPCIVVVEKLATDHVRESIKLQLAHLNQFVSVSPEIYNAIHTETVDES